MKKWMRLLSFSMACLLLWGCAPAAPAPEYEGVKYDGEAKGENFCLLYSTLGYEQKGTKKAYIRTLTPITAEKVGKKSEWTLQNGEGKTAAKGKLTYRNLCYGVQLWELDFSDTTSEGTYSLAVTVRDASGQTVFEETSQPFLVQKNLYGNHVLLPLTLYNAQARVSEEGYGGGYYDCNIQMGEAYSHGIFLNGLLQTWRYKQNTLTQEEKSGLAECAGIAFDYLLRLHNGETGEFTHSYPNRPNADVNLGIRNSQEALYGFAAYLCYFKEADPGRANAENYQKAVKSAAYLEQTPEWGLGCGYVYGEHMIPIYYYLYQYSGDEQWKTKAVNKLNELLEKVNVQTMERNGARAVPLFEGLYLLCRAFPDHPDHASWIQHATGQGYLLHIGSRKKRLFHSAHFGVHGGLHRMGEHVENPHRRRGHPVADQYLPGQLRPGRLLSQRADGGPVPGKNRGGGAGLPHGAQPRTARGADQKSRDGKLHWGGLLYPPFERSLCVRLVPVGFPHAERPVDVDFQRLHHHKRESVFLRKRLGHGGNLYQKRRRLCICHVRI